MIINSIKEGIKKGLRTAVFLLKIMLPIYIGVTILRHTEFFAWLAERIEPGMKIFSLPGEAVIPIIAGLFADEYAVVAAMSGFTFTAAQATIIAMVTLAFHSIPVETVITRQIGMPVLHISLFRVGFAVFTGFVIAYLTAVFLGGDLPGFSAEASSVVTDSGAAPVSSGVFNTGWDVILSEIGWGALNTTLNLLKVLIPVMIAIELMLAYRVIEAMAKKMGFFCRILGIGNEALLPLLVGLFFGVAYGAGALVELNRIRPLPPRDMLLLGVFLFSCHGIIETTYLYAIAGADVIFLSVVRFGIAIGVTAAAARLLRLKKGSVSGEQNYAEHKN